MSTQLATRTTGNMIHAEDMFSDARIDMIRNSVAKGAPPEVFAAMIDIAKRRNLDPLAKQIIVARFGSTWQMIVTIDGYRSIAEQTGQYAGSDAPVFTWEEEITTSAKKKAPTSASVTVYKMLGGIRCPFSATVYWEEYAGSNNWNTMPRTMLAKVAESHALRKAFPSVLSGTYTQEEMDQAKQSGEVIDTQTGEVKEYAYDPDTDTGVPPHAAALRGARSYDARQKRQDAPQRTERPQQVSVEVVDYMPRTAFDDLRDAMEQYALDEDLVEAMIVGAGMDPQDPDETRIARMVDRIHADPDAMVAWGRKQQAAQQMKNDPELNPTDEQLGLGA